MPGEVSNKMEYIQKVFLDVQNFMQDQPEMEGLIAFLEAIPPEFRSVAYESASMELAFHDLSTGTPLLQWENFYHRFGKVHSFHLDIGLGWAFAKLGISPASNLKGSTPLMQRMVFDGIGYYYGLFRGRRTVRNHAVPEGVEGEHILGFDQGLGRRLWYISQGDVKEVTQLIQSFPTQRHADLWCGVGIACGYVGGSKQEDLKLLLTAAGDHKQKLGIGVALAAMSRTASNCVTSDVETACQAICGLTLEAIVGLQTRVTEKIEPNIDPYEGYSHWMDQIELKLI